MKRANVSGRAILSGGILLFCLFGIMTVEATEPTVAEVTHSTLQDIDENGIGTYQQSDSEKVTVEGIVLNNPEEMDFTEPDYPQFMGGEWQIFVQSDDPCDHSGTAVWYGQNYARVGGSGSYTDEEFRDEMCRINRDPETGYVFSAGDKVRVTGWFKFYGGKTNINERHAVEDMFNFEIELVQPAAGLPEPEVITLDDVIDDNGNFRFNGDPNYGCEYYQGRLVRINDVNITDPENFAPDETIRIRDAGGKEFDIKLGTGNGFSRFDCPEGEIDVTGIFDQEAPGCEVCDYGYRLIVTNYDGNGLVLTDRGHHRGNLPGDVNGDFKVGFADFAEMAENWLETAPGLYGCD